MQQCGYINPIMVAVTLLGLTSNQFSSVHYNIISLFSNLMAEVENVDVNPRWTMPRPGFVKINIHGCFFVNALPNGNVTEIGIVIRNSRGRIIRMLSGSLGCTNPRINEFHAMLEGCKRAYAEKMEHFVLESDHVDSFWEWRNSSLEGAHPDHADIVQQLNQRNADRNFHMEVRLCETNANALAIYVAHHGAEHYKNMVIIAQPFGRVFELWNRDMGFGSAEPQYMAVHEDDLIPAVDNGDDNAEPEVEDGDQMMAGEEMVEVIEILD